MKIFKKHIIIVFSICLLSTLSYAQSNKKGNAKTGNFEKQTFVTDKSSGVPDKQAGPPGPGGGGGGDPIPISGGLSLLVLGSVAFWGRKIYNETRSE